MIAHELRRTLSEIDDMPYREFLAWIAYFRVRNAPADL